MFDKFTSKIRGAGLQSTNKYKVNILGCPIGGNTEDISLLAESVSFPGQNIRSAADPVRHGPTREQAQACMFSPFSITFICTTGMPEKLFFEYWHDHIANKANWETRYHDDYVATQIELIALDREENNSYRIEIYKPWPKTISPQSFSYSTQNTYQTVTVEFVYHFWESWNTPKKAPGRTNLDGQWWQAADAKIAVDVASSINPHSGEGLHNSTPAARPTGIHPPATPAQPAPYNASRGDRDRDASHGDRDRDARWIPGSITPGAVGDKLK